MSILADSVTGYLEHSSWIRRMDLWQIPVCRFTSEDGLRREGNNLFSATEDSGNMEMGVAGTENYGKINAYNIEHSNVDMMRSLRVFTDVDLAPEALKKGKLGLKPHILPGGAGPVTRIFTRYKERAKREGVRPWKNTARNTSVAACRRFTLTATAR